MIPVIKNPIPNKKKVTSVTYSITNEKGAVVKTARVYSTAKIIVILFKSYVC